MKSNRESADNKAWAVYFRDRVGGKVEIESYGDEKEEHSIDMAVMANEEGTVAATIGLMDFNIGAPGGREIFTEILLDRSRDNGFAAEVLSTLAFYVGKDGWKPRPGVVFESIVSMYTDALQVKHILFVSPFQWDDMFSVKLPGKTIHPLLAVPITEAEYGLVKLSGSEALEKIWVDKKTDVLDWGRDSAV